MVVGPLTSFRRIAPDAAEIGAWPMAVARACLDCALSERERWALWIPVGFGAGIGIYFSLSAEPSAWIAAAIGIAGMCSAIGSICSTRTGLRAALAILAAVSLGFGYAKLRAEWVAAPVLSHQIGPAGLNGHIETVQVHGKGVRVVLDAVASRRFRGETPARVRVSIRAANDVLVPGTWIHLTAMLMPPPGPAAPGGYDFGRAAYFDRIGGVGYAYGRASPIAPLRDEAFGERIATSVALLRWRMTERIQAALPGSTGGIASALITGDRGSISEDDEAALRDAGLAHVLAIAGLHMALVGLGLFWIVRALLAAIPVIALNHPIKKWAALAALSGATFYLIISGAATPATRAYVMLAVMLIAILADRPALSMRSVALAALIILLLRPESLIEPGFQMSFAAVVGLVAVAEWEAAHRSHEGMGPRAFAGVRRYMRGIAITSLVGSIATAPYAVFHFDRATHYAVLGNLLAMPVMGFVTMPFAAISVIAMPFGLEAWPLKVMGFGIAIMLSMGRFVSGLPGAISAVAAWPVGAIVLMSLGGLWMALWRRNWRWFGALPAVAGIALAFLARGPDLLVARDAATVAVRGSDGVLRLVRAANDDYSADEWLKRDGDGRDSDAAVATRKDGVNCDGYGCIAKGRDGTLIAAVARIDALAEDCANATIVISAVPANRHCTGPKLVIDNFDVARAGGYAVWLGLKMRVETVEGERGKRPWSLKPQPPRDHSQYRRMRPTSFPWTRTRSAP
jgi:competence protein ComEC